MKLAISAAIKLLVGLALIGVMLFLPAGTMNYPGAWLFLGVLFVPMLAIGIVLIIKSPSLLEKRLNAKEKQGAQKGVVAVSALMFPIGFVLAGLDFRFAWSSVSPWAAILAAGFFLFGYGMYAEVMRENAYLSRTVEVQENQKVVSTGLYGIVRHPMYLATLFMFLSMPIILGSLYAIIPFLLYPIAIVVRIAGEEKLLSEELEGYEEYKTRVKYRLIPFIW